MIFKRLFHQSSFLNFQLTQLTSNQSNLSKLRKSTGYALNLCKSALEKNENDVDRAAKWLDEQAQLNGWNKAEKLKDRATSQGLLGFTKTSTLAAIVELNCETDFVAKNEKFIKLLATITKTVANNLKTDNQKKSFAKSDLIGLKLTDNRTIADEIALTVSSVGENLSLRRAVLFNIPQNTHIGHYIHGQVDSIENCLFGRYVGLVNFKLKPNEIKLQAEDIGRQLGQQIVGLKPTSIGEISIEKEQKPEEIKFDDNESRLLYQEFLLKPNTQVYDFLKENGVEVVDFVRVECGETLREEQ